MADPNRPHDAQDDDEDHFEDEGRRSIFSVLWFRVILVAVILGVVAAVAVPYILEVANQPPPKPTVGAKPEPTPAPPAAGVPAPAPPSAATPVQPPGTEKPPAVERPAPAPPPMTPTAPEKPAAVAKRTDTAKSAVAREQATARPAPTPGGAYFVQVGAFKSQESAKRLAARLRELKYSVQESSLSGAKPGRASTPSSAPSAVAGPAGGDKYDVYVTGGAPADINAKLAAKGLTSEPSGDGLVVKPSLPLRDAVALSKDLAVDGLKVQVRRSGAASAASPAASGSGAGPSGVTVYRVRVGPFDDRATAASTLRELEQRGYTPFLARGGQ